MSQFIHIKTMTLRAFGATNADRALQQAPRDPTGDRGEQENRDKTNHLLQYRARTDDGRDHAPSAANQIGWYDAPPIAPINAASNGAYNSGAAETATNPAINPFKAIVISGLP